MIETLSLIIKNVKEESENILIREETDLIEEIGLDSLETIQFILGLEDEFNVEIDFDDFDFELLHRVGDLLEFIERTKAL